MEFSFTKNRAISISNVAFNFMIFVSEKQIT